jgi:hypothetical protein
MSESSRPSLYVAYAGTFVFAVLMSAIVLAMALGSQLVSNGTMFVAGLALIPSLLMVALVTVLPFGWQAAVMNLLLAVSAESRPLGQHRVHTVPVPASGPIGSGPPTSSDSIHSSPSVH